MRITVLLFIYLCGWSIAGAAPMTQDEMENIVADSVDVVEQQKGRVIFTFKKIKMALISDVTHDRMRIIAPIKSYSEVSADQKDRIMESNFHKALDARYAVSNGVLYSAFIHPMSPLTKSELEDALSQVSTLALNFGSTYSSGNLTFGAEK